MERMYSIDVAPGTRASLWLKRNGFQGDRVNQNTLSRTKSDIRFWVPRDVLEEFLGVCR